MPRNATIQTVLLIGSGPIVIGQAAEFDYAGTQACKALREEGMRVILVNSNPATIMTDEGVADVTYIEPLTVDVLARIIARERPDGVLGTLGGQTGLNLAVALAEAGVLETFGRRAAGHAGRDDPEGRRPRGVQATAARDLASRCRPAARCTPSRTRWPSPSRDRAAAGRAPRLHAGRHWRRRRLDAATILRAHRRQPASTPAPSIRCWSSNICAAGKRSSMRSSATAGDTCITVCNMENLDPLGIHTGDSIVVAPSQTLTDREYQMLRGASIHIIRALGVRGRLQRPVRAGSALRAILRHRGQSARQPLLGAGQQSDRLSHRARRRPRSPSAIAWTRFATR